MIAPFGLGLSSRFIGDTIAHGGADAMIARCRPNAVGVLIICLLIGVLVSDAKSQPRTVPEAPLVIDGRVLWVDFGSQTMALAPANGTPVIAVDVRRLPQSDYQGFRGNEYVRIVGYILRPNPRIQAFELYLITPWYPAEPQSP